MQPEFPISVRFENGEIESYDDLDELIYNLEDFDSEVNIDCEARDALGRRVRLEIEVTRVEGIVFSLNVIKPRKQNRIALLPRKSKYWKEPNSVILSRVTVLSHSCGS